MVRKFVRAAIIGSFVLAVFTLHVNAQPQPILVGSWQQVSDVGLVGWGNVLTVVDGSHLRGPHGGANYRFTDPTHMVVTNGPIKLVFTVHVAGDSLTTTGPYQGAYSRVMGRPLPLDAFAAPMEGTWRQTAGASLELTYHPNKKNLFQFATVNTHSGDVIRFDGTARRGTLKVQGRTLPYHFVNAEIFAVNIGDGGADYEVIRHTLHQLVLLREDTALAGGVPSGPTITFERQ